MHVLIVGAGLVGMTTAYECRRAGYDVTLVDMADAVAAETSHANGGQIAVSESAPWSRPGLVGHALAKLGRADAPFRLNLRCDAAQWRWLLSFLRNCAPSVHRRAIRRNWHLADYSRKVLRETRAAMGNDFDYQGAQLGILQFASCPQAVAEARRTIDELAEIGVSLEWLDAPEVAAREAALGHAVESGRVCGAIWAADDESGDARIFTEKLGGHLAAQGVDIRLGVRVMDWLRDGADVRGVMTCAGALEADKVVLASGTGTNRLLQPLGVSLPMLPVKGYSLTFPVRDSEAAPHRSLTDLAQRLVMSRLGDRLRVAGYAEIGTGGGIETRRVEAIRGHIGRLFPDALDIEEATPWCGFRPMTADGAPVLGALAGVGNLFLNTGHGALGWTLCHATARMTAEMLGGAPPECDAAPFAPDRRFVA